MTKSGTTRSINNGAILSKLSLLRNFFHTDLSVSNLSVSSLLICSLVCLGCSSLYDNTSANDKLADNEVTKSVGAKDPQLKQLKIQDLNQLMDGSTSILTTFPEGGLITNSPHSPVSSSKALSDQESSHNSYNLLAADKSPQQSDSPEEEERKLAQLSSGLHGFMIGQLQLERGEHNEALNKLKASADLLPDTIPSLEVQLAELLIKDLKLAEALTHSQNAISAYSQSSEATPEIQLLHADLLFINKKYQEAANAYQKLIDESHQRDDIKLLYLASLAKCQNQEQFNLALLKIYQDKSARNQFFAQTVAKISNSQADSELNPEILLEISLHQLEDKQLSAAERSLIFVTALEPLNNDARYFLGSLYAGSGDKKSAVDHFDKVTSSSPNFTKSKIISAYLLRADNNKSRSFDIIADALLQQKSFDEPLLGYFLEIARLDNRILEASKILKELYKKTPENLKISLTYAALLLETNQGEVLSSLLSELLAKDPNNSDILNVYAFFLAESSQNLEQGEVYARRALETKPDDGLILDTLAWVLHKQGKNRDALKYINKANRKLPNDHSIIFHSAEIYRSLSDIKNAIFKYQQAVAIIEKNFKPELTQKLELYKKRLREISD
jgi:tetratricopeptide (TPR) repeat protein